MKMFSTGVQQPDYGLVQFPLIERMLMFVASTRVECVGLGAGAPRVQTKPYFGLQMSLLQSFHW